jgi:hypothetical protein
MDMDAEEMITAGGTGNNSSGGRRGNETSWHPGSWRSEASGGSSSKSSMR